MRIVDCVVIAAYLVAVFGLGFACRGRKHNVDEYFTARGVFRGPLGTLLIGLSICASFISGLSLIALNSSAYTDGLKVAVFSSPLPLHLSWHFMRGWFPASLPGRPTTAISPTVTSSSVTVRVSAGWCAPAYRSCSSSLRVGWMALSSFMPHPDHHRGSRTPRFVVLADRSGHRPGLHLSHLDRWHQQCDRDRCGSVHGHLARFGVHHQEPCSCGCMRRWPASGQA